MQRSVLIAMISSSLLVNKFIVLSSLITETCGTVVSITVLSARHASLRTASTVCGSCGITIDLIEGFNSVRTTLANTSSPYFLFVVALMNAVKYEAHDSSAICLIVKIEISLPTSSFPLNHA